MNSPSLSKSMIFRDWKSFAFAAEEVGSPDAPDVLLLHVNFRKFAAPQDGGFPILAYRRACRLRASRIPSRNHPFEAT